MYTAIISLLNFNCRLYNFIIIICQDPWPQWSKIRGRGALNGTGAGQVAEAELDINNLFEVIGKGWDAMTKLRPPSQ